LQYAALAKDVKGLKAEICDEDSVVMACLLIVAANADPTRRAADARARHARCTMVCDGSKAGTSEKPQRVLI